MPASATSRNLWCLFATTRKCWQTFVHRFLEVFFPVVVQKSVCAFGLLLSYPQPRKHQFVLAIDPIRALFLHVHAVKTPQGGLGRREIEASVGVVHYWCVLSAQTPAKNNPTNTTTPPSFLVNPSVSPPAALLNRDKVVAVLAWHGFPARSEVPAWIRSLLVSLPEDALRRFLIFVCGTPSLPAPAAGKVRGGKGMGARPHAAIVNVGFYDYFAHISCTCAQGVVDEALLCIVMSLRQHF